MDDLANSRRRGIDVDRGQVVGLLGRLAVVPTRMRGDERQLLARRLHRVGGSGVDRLVVVDVLVGGMVIAQAAASMHEGQRSPKRR